MATHQITELAPGFHPCPRCQSVLDALASRTPPPGVLFVPLVGRRSEETNAVVAWTTVRDDDTSRVIIAAAAWSYTGRAGFGYATCGYATRLAYGPRGRDRLYLHRVVFEAYQGPIPDGLVIDHIDQNKLNNVPENLRAVTVGENNRNRSKRSDNRAGFKNVFWHKAVRKWTATITIAGKGIRLGYFESAREAADAVNAAWPHYFPGLPLPNPAQ